MHVSPFGDADFGGLPACRIATFGLVILLVSSGAVGVLGSSDIAAAQPGSVGSNTTTAGTGNDSTASNPINATIQAFQRKNLGWDDLSSKEKKRVRSILKDVQKHHADLGRAKLDSKMIKVSKYLVPGFSGKLPFSKKGKKRKKVKDSIENHINTETSALGDGNLPDIHLSNLIHGKLKSLADSSRKGATKILGSVYDLAFSTPVPHNDGWHEVFGQPTNSPFQKLYLKLLVGKLYPLTNYLLGLGVLVLGLSLVVDPLISRFRALDLMIKFVTFLLLYGFSWAAVTLMHGITNDVTLWLAPSAQEMGALVANIGAIKAGAIGAVGAYFAGAGGILVTVLSLGIELGLRKIALTYFFPYVFAPLVLLVYLSPWQRLRTYASTAIWQYVNVLTMVIPMAIVLRAAAITGPTLDGTGVVLMLTVIGLFLVTAIFPFISTYFFFQVAGSASGVLKGAATGAASRVGAATNRLTGEGDDSASTSTSTDSTATAGSTPSERTAEAVDASSQSRSSGASTSSSGLNTESPVLHADVDADEPTAAQVRALDDEQHRDPMNPTAMKEAYLNASDRRSTLKQKLAERSDT